MPDPTCFNPRPADSQFVGFKWIWCIKDVLVGSNEIKEIIHHYQSLSSVPLVKDAINSVLVKQKYLVSLGVPKQSHNKGPEFVAIEMSKKFVKT